METQKNKFKLILIILMIINSGQLYSQWLIAKPECITYDILRNRYLVSCFYAGSIVAIDSNGNQSIFKSGLGYAYSNTIYQNTIYVSTSKTIKGFDLTNGTQVMSVYIPTAHQLDGMTTDTSGNLYIVDFHYGGTSDQIFKINLNTQTYSAFVPPGVGLVHMPQDLFYDKPNNRLIVVSATVDGPIQAINLSDSSISTILTTTYGSFDGIEMDTSGNYYLSNWTLKTVIKYDHNFANPPVTIFSNQKEPSNLGYNKKKHVLAVPFFNADTVVFLSLGSSGIINRTNEIANEYSLFQNYPNPFNPATRIKFKIRDTRFVSLKVYNILGKEITTLVNEKLKMGEYEVHFPDERMLISEIPGGIYFYRLVVSGANPSAGNFIETKKMIFIK